jgi:putative hydrolase of the HAD superfamily
LNLPPIRAVCFDFDQTLGCYDPPHLGLYVLAAREHGSVVTESALGAPLEDAWERWRTPLGIDHAHAATEADFREVRRTVHRARVVGAGIEDGARLEATIERLLELETDPTHFRLYEDARPTLERLAVAGVAVAIVSNHIWPLPEIVEALGLDDVVDAVITSARVGVRKPHPAIYEAVLRDLDVPAEESERVLFVGDSLSADVEGPRAFGMRAVLLDRSSQHRGAHGDDSRGGIDGAIASLDELPVT